MTAPEKIAEWRTDAEKSGRSRDARILCLIAELTEAKRLLAPLANAAKAVSAITDMVDPDTTFLWAVGSTDPKIRPLRISVTDACAAAAFLANESPA